METGWFSGAGERTLQPDYLEAEDRTLLSVSLMRGRELGGSPILASGIADPLHHSGNTL